MIGQLHSVVIDAPDAHAREVPDPYYGDTRGFEAVLDLVQAASEGLVIELLRDRKLRA